MELSGCTSSSSKLHPHPPDFKQLAIGTAQSLGTVQQAL